MPQLHLIRDNEVTRSFPLEHGEMLLGREDYCDISLGYAGISRRHLRLLTVMGDTFVEDMGSRNGTYVNGRLARKCALNDGDILQIGEIELRFEKDSANDALGAAQDPDATTVLSPGRFGPRSRAARDAGTQVDGISPVAHFTAKAEQLQSEQRTPTGRKYGLWERMCLWLGL
jgi:pSer/pThr/pTyr-binding forkhead associated (FHA) protein